MSESLDLFKAFQDKPVSYYKTFADITWSVTAWVLLSQIVYWDGAMNHQEFWKKDLDFCRELWMWLYEFKGAKSKLSKYVLITRRGMPARTYYKLDREVLISEITCYVKKQYQVSGKTTNKKVEKPLLIPENTKVPKGTFTENTTEIDNTTNVVLSSQAIVEWKKEAVDKRNQEVQKVLETIKTSIHRLHGVYRAGKWERNFATHIARAHADWWEFIRNRKDGKTLIESIDEIITFSLSRAEYVPQINNAVDFWEKWDGVVMAMRKEYLKSKTTTPPKAGGFTRKPWFDD